MLGEFRIEEFAAQRSEAFERAALIGADQPQIARHIRGENGGQPAFEPLPTHRYGNPAARQASMRGSASAAGTAKPAQWRSIVKFG